MKIVTWNCCLPPWSLSRKKRLPGIVFSLKDLEADILCLQEVFFRRDANFIVSKLKAAGFHDSFYFKDLLVLSRTRFSDKKEFVFQNQGELFSLSALDFLYGKAFQIVQVESEGRKVCLVNTHLLSGGDKYHFTRKKQIEEICEKLEQLRIRSVIVGDLNFEPNAGPYQIVMKHSFFDPFGQEEKTTKGGRLDHIFLKGFKGSEAKIVFSEKNLSDHAGLCIRIQSA